MAALNSSFTLDFTDKELVLDDDLATNNELSVVVRNSNNLKLRSGDIELAYEGGTIHTDNLSAENIKKDVTILGITGTMDENVSTADATATSADILSGKTAYVNGEKIEGSIFEADASSIVVQSDKVVVPGGYYSEATTKTLPTTEVSKPSITVSAAGVITATVNQGAGYTVGGTAQQTQQISGGNLKAENIKHGTTVLGVEGSYTDDATAESSELLKGKTAYVKGSKVTGTIESKDAETYTPGTTAQIISSGKYLRGDQTIKGDENLVAANIKSGVKIFGVTGSLTSGADDSNNLTATADDILNGKTALVKGNIVTGTIESKEAETYTPTTTNQIIYSGKYLSGNQIIQGDANLLPENIKKGTTIFGVEGTANEGINPEGNINITDTNPVDVTNYATATVSDSDLIAENIKSGESILGISGVFTSDATATADKILKGETAYVKGEMITGTIESQGAKT
jgi:hypothetical protein